MTDFTDLLGLPYRAYGTDPATGIDCAYVCRVALERIFPDFRSSEFPLTASEQAARLALARQGVESWIRVGDNTFAATALGDLVISERANGALNVAVLVNVERREAITATHGYGVQILPMRRILGVRDVFRRPA